MGNITIHERVLGSWIVSLKWPFLGETHVEKNRAGRPEAVGLTENWRRETDDKFLSKEVTDVIQLCSCGLLSSAHFCP